MNQEKDKLIELQSRDFLSEGSVLALGGLHKVISLSHEADPSADRVVVTFWPDNIILGEE